MPISERELLNAMADTGRTVTFATLAEWRRCGLLPAFASRSCGLRKGKMCYWPDDDTLDRAVLIYDVLQSEGERHSVVWLLWLSGITLPLPYVRRAWLQKAKAGELRKRARSGNGSGKLNSRLAPGIVHEEFDWEFILDGQITTGAMLHAALMACDVLDPYDDPELEALIVAIERVMAGNSGAARTSLNQAVTRKQIVSLLRVIWAAVRTSELITSASDMELLESQKFTSAALRLHQSCAGPGNDRFSLQGDACRWPVAEVRTFGAPLFFLIMVMLRSGQRSLLDRAIRTTTNMVAGSERFDLTDTMVRHPVLVDAHLR
jgi:hypothetical protein